MDPLTALLDAPRARGAFLLKVTMSPPWSVRVEDRAPLSVVAVTRGTAWFVPDDGDAVQLAAGDLLLIARPDPYFFCDSPGRAPQAVIHPGGRCETPAGASLDLPAERGVRTWGNAAAGHDTMLVGTYPSVNEVGSRLLRSLPPAIVVRAGDHTSGGHASGLVGVLAQEIEGEGLGQASLLDRLLDGLTVEAIRHWAAAPDAAPPAWLRADDPVVARSLELMHDRVAHPWTVADLADEVGLSRAAFARRFTAGMGEGPMAYLASWRLALAADRLVDDDLPVSRLATELGYASPFTFSTAFKRHHGISPAGYRRRERASESLAGPPELAESAE